MFILLKSVTDSYKQQHMAASMIYVNGIIAKTASAMFYCKQTPQLQFLKLRGLLDLEAV